MESAGQAGAMRGVRVVAASSLLLAAVVCTVYVASQGSEVPDAIAALGAPAVSQATLEQQLQRTKAQLAHEASIISSLRAKEGKFKSVLEKAGTSKLAGAASVKTQKLDGEEPAAEGEEAGAGTEREKEELEKAETTHFNARHAALTKALSHAGEMNAQNQRHIKWKAAHEMYEAAAYKDISGEEHNRTEVEPEADALMSKYEESALKVDGTAGYNALLEQANHTDIERMKQWDEFLAVQKNRTTLFPEVDKTKGPEPNWPDDRLRGQGAAFLHSTATATLHQKLAPGEHVEAVGSFLLAKDGLLPMKAGEEATVLKINKTTGVDRIITGDGRQGLFPGEDLVPENAAERVPARSVRVTSRNLHLPPKVKGNVVDAAVREGAKTFAAQLAKAKDAQMAEDERRAEQAQERRAPSKAAHVEEKKRASTRQASASTSVVTSAIQQADDVFEEAKRKEIALSRAARAEYQQQVDRAHAVRSSSDVMKSVASAHQATVVEDSDLGSDLGLSNSHAASEEGMSDDLKKAVTAAEKTFDQKINEHGEEIEKDAEAAADDEGKGKAGAATAGSSSEDGKKMSPEMKAAIAAAEDKFDKKMDQMEASKTADDAKTSKARVVASTSAKAPKLHAEGAGWAARSAEEKRAHDAVQLGLDSHDAAYRKAVAREESRSLKKRTLETRLRRKELKVHEAMKTAREMRDKLALEQTEGKRAAVARQLAAQSDMIGGGIGEEESFSATAQKGEARNSLTARIADAGATVKKVAEKEEKREDGARNARSR